MKYDKEKAYVIKNNLWCKWDIIDSKWQKCSKDDDGAVPDLNTATEQMVMK